VILRVPVFPSPLASQQHTRFRRRVSPPDHAAGCPSVDMPRLSNTSRPRCDCRDQCASPGREFDRRLLIPVCLTAERLDDGRGAPSGGRGSGLKSRGAMNQEGSKIRTDQEGISPPVLCTDARSATVTCSHRGRAVSSASRRRELERGSVGHCRSVLSPRPATTRGGADPHIRTAGTRLQSFWRACLTGPWRRPTIRLIPSCLI
jgi:hypothetical protein